MNLLMQYHAAPNPENGYHYELRNGFFIKTTRPILDAGARYVKEAISLDVIICGVNIETWIDGTQQIVVNVVPVVEALGHELFQHSGWFRKELTRGNETEIRICTKIPALQDLEIDSEKKRRIIRVGRTLPMPGQIWLGRNRKEDRYYLAGLQGLSDLWIPKTLKDRMRS